jgi:ABC-type sugar transport system permease subunit
VKWSKQGRTAREVIAQQGSPFQGREISERWFVLVMNVPSLGFMLFILLYPIVFAGYLSFHRVGIAQMRTGDFPSVGWRNYLSLFQDELFLLSLKNTMTFTAIVVPAELVISVAVALLIHRQDVWTSRVSKLLVLLPYAVPPIASGMIWDFIYNGKVGYLNRVLYSLGAIDSYVNWAGHSETAIYAVAVAYIWRTVPFSILLVHAALQGIPEELFDASRIDGCGPWRTFVHVTVPLLRPVIMVTLILRTTFAIMVFEEVMAITQGGPGDATWTATWFTYRSAFNPPFDIGLGASSAYILALIAASLAIVYFKFLYRRVLY